MAFNLQTFKTRALTAIIFAAVMLVGLLWNHWSFFILFSIIHFGCWIEYQKLVALIDPGYNEITPFHKYGVMIAGWCLMLWFSSDDYSIFGMRLHEIGWWLGLIIAFILPITELLFTKNIQLKNIGHSVFGLVYISLSWGLMMDLQAGLYFLSDDVLPRMKNNSITPEEISLAALFQYKGLWLCLIAIFTMWINDTMAYIVGSIIGKTPLSKVSPKKTWEGTIGGIILSSIAIGLLAYYYINTLFFEKYSVWLWLGLPLVAAIAGTFGDLLESKLKRMAGVKDSGSLMPGHGGFLDRFDSLLLAVPFVWLYVQLFMR